MYLASAENDSKQVAAWGDRWLRELDTTKPTDDDERSALDIARVDAAGILGDPMRVIPALITSEQAMPENYNASLRLAQMQNAAKHYDEALAACDRGLQHVTGPLGRSWLLQTKADALLGKEQPADAERVLREALKAAQSIPVESSRNNNIKKIQARLDELANAQKNSDHKAQ